MTGGIVPIRIGIPIEDYPGATENAHRAGFPTVSAWLTAVATKRSRYYPRRAAVLALWEVGKTNAEISIALGETVQYVGNVIRHSGRSSNRKRA